MIKIILICIFVLTNCGYNQIQVLDEKTKSNMSEILNQYKRRADLIPNLINTVEAYSLHEKDVIVEIAKARISVNGLGLTPELLNNSEKFKIFENTQNTLGSSLQKLLIVSEKYPNLKANEGFKDLQAQLEGTENRITVARRNYIKSIEEYNIFIRQFPESITAKIFGFELKSSFTIENESEIKNLPSSISKPPEVEFGKKK